MIKIKIQINGCSENMQNDICMELLRHGMSGVRNVFQEDFDIEQSQGKTPKSDLDLLFDANTAISLRREGIPDTRTLRHYVSEHTMLELKNIQGIGPKGLMAILQYCGYI
jgi:hypothetical protein